MDSNGNHHRRESFMTVLQRKLAPFLIVLLCLASPAIAAKRVALVIGNSSYKHVAELKNPRADANDIAAVLRRLGFEVIEGVDLDKRAMSNTIRKFSSALNEADVALFYYAGHGLQVKGQNYLAPIDAKLSVEADLDFDMVPLNLVLRQMERAKRTNLIFLDACRDNPLLVSLARSMGASRSAALTRGLARVDTGVGTLISYSTQPGNVALDGEGRNSPFTTAVLKHIETPGLDVSEMMISVRKDVLKSSNGRQVPWENSSLTGQFFFKEAEKTVTATPSPVNTPKPQVTRRTETVTINQVDKQVLDLTFWNSIKASKDAADFKAYVEKFPKGIFASIAQRRMVILSQPKEQKQAALTPPAPPKPVKTPEVINTPPPPQPLLDPALITTSLQRELKRVGCYRGAIDGDWGPGSRSALRRFNGGANTKLPVDSASQAALDQVKKQTRRICVVPAVANRPPAERRTNRQRPTRKKTTTRRQRRAAPAPRSREKRCRTVFTESQGPNEAPWTRVCD